ncbi:hypothetical protein GOY11_34055, partial [Pseudomonas aeruginosa]|nr:hypothetical protein [Pseudomonas aeruginosa]
PVMHYSLTVGVMRERCRAHSYAGPTMHTLFVMTRGVSDDSCCGGAHAQELIKWFDTNYHYLVHEFSADQQFQLSWAQLFEEVDESRALCHHVKPVLIVPLTYLLSLISISDRTRLARLSHAGLCLREHVSAHE